MNTTTKPSRYENLKLRTTHSVLTVAVCVTPLEPVLAVSFQPTYVPPAPFHGVTVQLPSCSSSSHVNLVPVLAAVHE